jgi:hypothetical protein
MKPSFVIPACIVALCAAGFAQTSQPGNSEAQALIGKSRAVLEAIKAKDVTALNGILAENFRSVGLAGDVGSRQEMLGAAREGFMKDFLFYDAQTFAIDSDSILVTYNSAITLSDQAVQDMVDDNITWPRYAKVSDLWVRQDGDWKLKFEQVTPVRAIY